MRSIRYGLTAAAVMTAIITTAVPASAVDLGLAERRAIQNYQEKFYPDLLKGINDAVGAPIEVEVKWDTMAGPGQAEKYSQPGYWTDIYFVPLVSALKAVASDAMGKKAVQEKLKKIVIFHDTTTAPASNYINGVTFESGTLSINFHPYSNVSDVDSRAKAIQKLLESKL
jgi:hypothetical protein